MIRAIWTVSLALSLPLFLVMSTPALLSAQTANSGESLNDAPGGPPGTTLGAQSPDAIPATGPMASGGEVSTPQGSDQSIVPGGEGDGFPSSRGTGFPGAKTPGLGQDGRGTGTGSTLGGSGTGTGGLSVGD